MLQQGWDAPPIPDCGSGGFIKGERVRHIGHGWPGRTVVLSGADPGIAKWLVRWDAAGDGLYWPRELARMPEGAE